MELEKFLIKEGLYDPGIFKAFFLAGGPGSGKTYVNKKIFPGLGLKNVNSDDAVERALKKAGLSMDFTQGTDQEIKQRMKFRSRAKQTTKRGLEGYVDGRLGLVLDATARDNDKTAIAKAALDRLGYDTYMIFVNTSLRVALARNAERERVVHPHIVKKSHAQVQKGIGKLQMLFGMKNFFIIDNNNATDDVLNQAYKMIRKIVKTPIKNYTAKLWMRKELEKKQAAFESRNYAQEYERYHKRPEQIARRSSRNKARRVMGDKVVKGLDVGHKDNDPMNNDPKNLRNEDPKVNRREPRLRDRDITKENKMSEEDFYDPITEACWTGFKQVGMKMKNGKSVPNCVPIKDAKIKESFREFAENAPNTADAMKRHKAGKAGFTDKAHLKAKGLIPRADGEKKVSDKYK